MTYYSPFEKDFADLAVADLSALRAASEGWYIEYKREVPNANGIAKSLAAFANSYGGWLFYGVDEASKENPAAGAFPGISMGEADASLQRIRQAAANCINPAPYFETRLLQGPNADLGLDEGQAILVVRVPQGINAPYIHKSGQIYRRVADGSEPKPENDRFLLDSLFRRSDDLRQQYKDWLARDPELSKAEENSPFLRLMITVDPWAERDPWLETDLAGIRDIFNSGAASLISGLPFDSVHKSPRGFIARQIHTNDPSNLGLTWRFRQTLTGDVIVPLKVEAPREPFELLELDGYQHIRRYIGILQKGRHARPQIIDLNLLFNLLTGIVERQEQLMAAAGWQGEWYFKVRLLNVWRTIPFLDVPIVLDEFEAHGIPLCLDETVTVLDGSDPETLLRVDRRLDIESPHARVLLQALALFEPIASAWGISAWMPVGEDQPAYYQQLQLAGARALKVQANRTPDTNKDR